MKEQIEVLTEQLRHEVLKRILENGYGDKLWMKKRMEAEWAESGLVFYPAKNNQKEMLEALRRLFSTEMMEVKQLPIVLENKNRILLEFEREKYHIPFFIEIEPYKEILLYPAEEEFEKLKYLRFPIEEYLAQGFYEIVDKLELLNDFSWYKEVYDILLTETVDGRRVRDCFGKLLERKAIPSLEKRLDTIKGYADYEYMKKKWKKEKKRQRGELPEWEEVVSLLVTFFSPIFDAVIHDEVFFEDWMPQLGRYL